MNEVKEAAFRLHNGAFGNIRGTGVHGFGGEISGSGCQHISVLCLLTNVEQNTYFLDCVKSGTPVSFPAANLDEAVKTMELCEATLSGLR